MRLVKMAQFEKHQTHKDQQIEKELTIYNCLLDSVTENVQVLSTAGAVCQYLVQIDNFHDRPINLSLLKMPPNFKIEKGTTINELGLAEFTVPACDSVKLALVHRFGQKLFVEFLKFLKNFFD